METGTYQAFALSKIREPLDPARMTIDPQKLGELADSIAAEGLHQPVGLVLDADGDGAVLAWGHRRLMAHRLLRRDVIDAKVFPSGTDLALARWSENGQRDDLNPLEEAHEVRRFLERGFPIAHIVRLFRRSEAWGKDRLALLDLPDDLKQCIANKSLPLAVVSILRGVDHAGYRESLIREAIGAGASAPVVAVWLQHYLADRDRLVSNHVTIEELARERVNYRLMVGCEWCEEQHGVEDTRSMRLCNRCAAGLEAAKRSAMEQPA